MTHREMKLWKQVLKMWPEAMEYEYTPVFLTADPDKAIANRNSRPSHGPDHHRQ